MDLAHQIAETSAELYASTEKPTKGEDGYPARRLVPNVIRLRKRNYFAELAYAQMERLIKRTREGANNATIQNQCGLYSATANLLVDLRSAYPQKEPLKAVRVYKNLAITCGNCAQQVQFKEDVTSANELQQAAYDAGWLLCVLTRYGAPLDRTPYDPPRFHVVLCPNCTKDGPGQWFRKLVASITGRTPDEVS
jgi:hypothetical protein